MDFKPFGWSKSARAMLAGASAVIIVTALLQSAPALAQASIAPQFQDPPEYQPIVEGEVNVASGAYIGGTQSLSIGQPGQSGLTTEFPMVGHCGGWNQALMLGLGCGSGNWTTFLHQVPTPNGFVPMSWGMVISVEGRSYSFFCVGLDSCNEWGEVSGATVHYDSTRGGYLFTARDGTLAFFAGAQFPNNYYTTPVTSQNAKSLSATYLVRPNGEKVTFYQYALSSSLGWMIKSNYTSTNVSIVLINTSKEYCDPNSSFCALTKPWQTLTISAGQTGDPFTSMYRDLTNALAQVTHYTATGDGNFNMLSLTKTLPSGRTTNVYYDTAWGWGSGSSSPIQHVSKVISRGQTWNYSYRYISHNGGGWSSLETTTSRPDLATAVVETMNTGQGFRFVDGLSRTTSVEVVQPGSQTVGTIQSITYPSGKNLAFTYGTPGSITKRTLTPPSGTPGPLEENFTYGGTGCTPVNCNQVWSRTDPAGKTSSATYDPVHGGVLIETWPADQSGVTPQKRYSYTQLYPKVLNSSGILVNSDPVWRLTRVSECLTATATDPASCVGTAQERVTTIAYNDNNLLPTSTTVAAGDGSNSVTTSTTYDDFGNIISVDGPRTDVDDRSYATYDALRRKVYEIAIDPDGSGPLPRKITHHVYDADGNETRTEEGTGFTTDGSDFTLLNFKRTTFDPITGLATKIEEVKP